MVKWYLLFSAVYTHIYKNYKLITIKSLFILVKPETKKLIRQIIFEIILPIALLIWFMSWLLGPVGKG